MILNNIIDVIGLIKTLGASLLSPTGALLGIVAATGLAVTAFNHFNPSIEEQKEKLSDLNDEYENTVRELQTLGDEIEKNNKRIQELLGKKNDGETLTLIEEDEIRQLTFANKLLKEQKQIEQDNERKAASKLSDSNRKTFGNEFGSEIYLDNAQLNANPNYGQYILATDYENMSNKEVLLMIKAMYQGIDDAIESGNKDIEDSTREYQDILRNVLIDRSGGMLQTLIDYQTTLTKFMNPDGTFDNAADQKMWDDIEAWKKSIYQETNRSGEWNTLQLDVVLNDSSLQQTQEEIKQGLDDGTLTEEDVSKYGDLITALEGANLILQDGETHASAYLRYLESIANSQEETSNASSIVLPKQYDFKDVLENIQQTDSMIKALTAETEENGRISVGTILDIVEKYPALTDAVHKYLDGKYTETDLINELQKEYAADLENYKLYILQKKGTDEGFYDTIISSLSQDLIDKAKQYDIELGNYSDYLEAKFIMDREYSSKKAALDAMTEKFNRMSENIQAGDPMNKVFMNTWREADKLEREFADIEEIVKAFDEAVTAALPDFNLFLDGDSDEEDVTNKKIEEQLAIANIKLDMLGMEDLETMSAKERNVILEKEKKLKYEILQYNLALAESEEEKLKLQKEYDKYLEGTEDTVYDNNRNERNNHISYYQSKVQGIQNDIDLEESRGGSAKESQYENMNLYLGQEMIYQQQNYEEALKKRDKYDVGTDKWEYYNGQVQEAANRINACTTAQIENNRAILLMPVQKYEEANKELEKQLDLQNKNLEKLESAYGYAKLLVQDEIDALNERKETISDDYDNQIKAIQEEKDALTASNDEREREISLQNAKFALEKAMNNRTVRVYKKGQGFTYESDQNAIRDAQNELDQLKFNNTIASLDKRIQILNKDKESDLELLDAEIKTWEIYAKKLDEAGNSYDRLISKRNFLELFKNGEADILSQDIGIINTFESSLNNAKLDIDITKGKIDENNLTISKIKEAAESYLGTTKQIKDAQDAIVKAIVENEKELTAIGQRSEKTKELGGTWTDADTEIKTALDLINSAQILGRDNEATVLGERKSTLEQFRDAAVLIYKEIANEVGKANLAFSTLETTLTNAQKTYKEILNLTNGTPAPEIPTFHSGGIVGKHNNELPEHLFALSEIGLKPNETLAKLLNGEVVLNNTQMNNIFDNLHRAYSALTPLNKRENSSIDVTIGDVNVYNPENTDMIVNEIVKELPLKVIQRLHSK